MRRVAITCAVIIVVSFIFQPLALAEPPTRPDQTSSATITKRASTWSAARMAAATSFDSIKPGTGSGRGTEPEAPANPGKIEPRLPTKAPQGIAPLANATPTTGKLFLHNPNTGSDGYCTASAINSGNLSQVITAAHCVHTGPNGCNGNPGSAAWMTEAEFVPLYWSGDRPYGTFQVRTLRTFDTWIADCDWDYDIAIVTTYTNENNQLLVETVGGNGLSYNYPGSFDSVTFGYPGNRDGGEIPWTCEGTTNYGFPDYRPTLYCAWTGGFSGGPWFREYSNDTLLGYVNGVGSTWPGPDDGPEWIDSPYFDDKVQSIYDDAAGD
ncbi:trypsin-like serine peptidase [Actinophytocola xanthii]|uniref:trypsin-like serine peptidase n=1 Tax=Actinophytocola xanthii TaxID=1912961 RepID=UPI00117882EB|nr:hypothetical protein [Actinophytocola xanthii]